MNPLRIIILALLFYVLYRLLFGRKKSVGKGGSQGPGRLGDEGRNILVEDPVCHTYVVQGQSPSAVKDGKTYYFCSEECRRKFLESN